MSVASEASERTDAPPCEASPKNRTVVRAPKGASIVESPDVLVQFFYQFVNYFAALDLSWALSFIPSMRDMLLVAAVVLGTPRALQVNLYWPALMKLSAECAAGLCDAFSFRPTLRSALAATPPIEGQDVLKALRIFELLGTEISREERLQLMDAV